MVGICGVVGDAEHGVEPLGEHLLVAGDERRTTYRDDRVSVEVAAHPPFHEAQPASTGDGALVWIHGTTYGFDGPDGYESRESTGDAAFCAALYGRHGIDFVAGLNGEFAGVVLDRSTDRVHLFTDRTGSVPLYHTRTDGALVLSSSLQAVGLHPGVEPTFDRGSLAEFFGVQKAFGTDTVLTDVTQVPPGATTTAGLDGSVRDTSVYWRPEYRPVDRSPAELAAAVNETFERVFADRLDDDRTYGVLLSGGSDSRLVLDCAMADGRTPEAFHLTNWRSRETRTAERVAAAAGTEFRTLERDADYHATLLEHVPEFSNFVGTFDEYVASGFADELGEVDVLLTGYLGDTMFGTYPLYRREWPLPVPLPFERRIRSVDEYVASYLGRYDTPAAVPEFLDAPALADVLLGRIGSEDGSVRHHGVEYRSLRELQLCEYYPLTNQYAFANSHSLRQIAGHWSPFFDNRLIDLHLSIPVRDRLRLDPINLALRERAPSLARIPHGWTGVPLDRSVRHGPALLGRKALGRLRRRLAPEQSPEPFLDHGPWMDEGELVRHHGFVRRAIDRNADLIEALPFLDRAAIDRCYATHLDGADNWRALYALVTLLESPVAERVADQYR